MNRLSFILAAVFLAFASAAAPAQELTTDAERDWRIVRNSEDVRTKKMAERWFNAIRQQDWSDHSGKFKVSAKYVEHDPNLAWVKLRVIRGTGKERQVKDVKIPLDKLSKSCQARVRTISVLAEKISMAKESEEEQAALAKEGNPGDMRDRATYDEATPNGPRVESGPLDAGLAEMDPREVMAERDPRGGRERGAEPPAPPASTGPPLPAALPPLPSSAFASSSPPAEPAVAAPSVEAAANSPESVPPLDAASPHFPDNDPWRTDYEAFRSAFVMDSFAGVSLREQWAGLLKVQELVPAELRGADPASREATQYVEEPRLAEVGDFQWECVVAAPAASDGNWAEILGLAPLAQPLKLEIRLQDEGQIRQVKVGDRVRVVGRFVGYRGPHGWVARIQLVSSGRPTR